MKKILIAAIACCTLGTAARAGLPEGARKILETVHAPEFRDAEYSVLDFGAAADTTVDSRKAVNLSLIHI